MRESQQELVDTQNTFSKEILEKLGDKITSQCDKLKDLKLVNHQINVQEEEIVDNKQIVVIFEDLNIDSTNF